jgi:hypothetical protein
MRCGYPGCKKRPHVESFFMGKHCWCYLCKEHYELLKHEPELGFYELTWLERVLARLSF